MSLTRKSYPSDASDAEWEFLLPYLTLMRQDAPQRDYSLRDVFDAVRYVAGRNAYQTRFAGVSNGQFYRPARDLHPEWRSISRLDPSSHKFNLFRFHQVSQSATPARLAGQLCSGFVQLNNHVLRIEEKDGIRAAQEKLAIPLLLRRSAGQSRLRLARQQNFVGLRQPRYREGLLREQCCGVAFF